MLVAQLACMNVVDPDLYHEMGLIRAARQIGSLPHRDLFAYTPTINPSVHHEWGTGLVTYAVTVALGGAGLTALKWLVMAGLVALCVHAARQRGTSWPVLCALAPIAIQLGIVGISTFRAQIFTLLFTALLLTWLDRDRLGSRRWVPAWLIVYVLWLNLHAGFVVGIGLVGAYWLEQVLLKKGVQWRLPAILAVMLGLVLLNPYGTDYPRYLWRGLFMPRPMIVEWTPLWRDMNLFVTFLIALLVAGYAIWKNGWRNSPGFLIVMACALAAVRYSRHANLLAVAFACYVPGWIQQTALAGKLEGFWQWRHKTVVALSVAVGAFCLVLAIAKTPWQLYVPASPHPQRFKNLVYPVGAVEYLRQQRFCGNVMTSFNSGSFVSWNLFPAVKVALDGRYEVAYQPGLLEEISDFYDAKDNWRGTLNKYPTDLVLARVDCPLALRMGETNWKCVYRDDAFVLFARPGIELMSVNRVGQTLVGTFP